MKIAARCQAIIELLDAVCIQQIPADYLLQNYFKTRRYVGAQDRRYIKNTFYDIVRRLPDLQNILHQIDLHLSDNGRAIFIAAWLFNCSDVLDNSTLIDQIFNNQQYAPRALSTDEQQLLQKLTAISAQGLTSSLPSAIQKIVGSYSTSLIQAYNQPAPLDLRVNTLKTNRDTVLQQLNQLSIKAQATPHSPIGIRLENRVSLQHLDFYKMGHVEIQDEGSQLAGYLALVKPASKILDLCAGGGGKTLQLATLMHNQAKITATDISAQRLEQCRNRLQYAGVTHVDVQAYDCVFKNQYDSVLIDAPCSGSGTWRRHPELKIHLTADKLQHYTVTQFSLLVKASDLIPIGGTIIYLTCSFFNLENAQQINKFLTAYPNFDVVPSTEWSYNFLQPFAVNNFLKIGPLNSNTDGFFGAILTKIY